MLLVIVIIVVDTWKVRKVTESQFAYNTLKFTCMAHTTLTRET